MENTATTEPVSARSVGLKYGLILGVVSIIYFLILVLAGANAFDNKWNWLGMIFSIGVLILAHKNFKESGDGFMSYGQGVGIAFWIALVSTVLGGLFTYLYAAVIDTAVMDTFYDLQRQNMETQGMPDDQIDMAVGWTKALFWPIYFFFGIFFGVLIGLIVTIFTQKKAPEQMY